MKQAKKAVKPRRKVLKSLTIDRARWGKRFLRNEDDTMCCLGFACLKLGVPADVLMHKAMPENLPENYQETLPKWLIAEGDYSSSHNAAGFNDEFLGGTVDVRRNQDVIVLDEQTREDRIRRICAPRLQGQVRRQAARVTTGKAE